VNLDALHFGELLKGGVDVAGRGELAGAEREGDFLDALFRDAGGGVGGGRGGRDQLPRGKSYTRAG